MHKTRRFFSSAPNKLVIAGEHSVVWGGLAVSAPVEVSGCRNRAKAGLSGGSGKIVVRSKSRGETVFYRGRLSGSKSYRPIARAVRAAVEKNAGRAALAKKDLVIDLKSCGAPKGTGNSASFSAAAICAALGLFGIKTSGRRLFWLVMPAEHGYHANKASGIDPLTVCSDHAIMFRRKGAGFAAKKIALSLPRGCTLLLADSSKGKRADATGKLINAFAGAHGLAGLPGNRSAAKRRQVTAPFDRIVKAIAKELDAQGNAPRLGLLLDWNQELLRRSDVSSEGIEAVIAVAKGAGALGAKLTGAGGRGGSVLVLARKQDEGRIRARLKARGYPAYRVRLSHRGACGA